EVRRGPLGRGDREAAVEGGEGGRVAADAGKNRLRARVRAPGQEARRDRRMSDAGVLERNLERLFARAYVPVVPSAEFRARLQRELELALHDRQVRRPVDRSLRWRAAAAILLAIGAGLPAWPPLP